MIRSLASGMRKVTTKLMPAAAVAMALAFSGPAWADALSNAKAAGKLTVATEMQFAPFDMLVNGKYTGFNKDVLDEVGKELGLRMDYVDLPWTSVLPGLETGKFDFVGAPINATKERVARYGFTNPFAFSGSAFMKRAGDASIGKPEDLKGKTVGVVKASAILKQVQRFQTVTEVTIREYSDNNQLYADLGTGRIAAAASSLANVSYASAQRPEAFAVVKPTFGVPTYYCWITRKTDESRTLVEAVDSALARVIADGRMASIQKKWFGESYELPATLPEPEI